MFRFPASSFSTCLRSLCRVIVSNRSPQVDGGVDVELALGVAAVKSAEGGLHHVLRILLAAKATVHLPLDQSAKPGTVLVAHFLSDAGIRSRRTFRRGVCRDWRAGLVRTGSDSNSSARGTKEGGWLLAANFREILSFFRPNRSESGFS